MCPSASTVLRHRLPAGDFWAPPPTRSVTWIWPEEISICTRSPSRGTRYPGRVLPGIKGKSCCIWKKKNPKPASRSAMLSEKHLHRRKCKDSWIETTFKVESGASTLRSGKNTQNCTKKIFTTQIITMVWSLTYSQTSWNVKSNGPCKHHYEQS